MKSHEDLDAWQSAMSLAGNIYRQTSGWPVEERFGLTNQIRRAAVSVPSNIAEGAARGTDKDFLHFLDIALGSLAEVDTQFRLAQQLGYSTENSVLEEIITLRRMVLGLRKYLRERISSTT